MEQKTLKKNYRLLAHLLKELVAERFKRMAKDEVLFKFISHCVEPAVLVDHNLQAEKEALDLAEMSLLELVTGDRLDAELEKSAEKIQKNFQRMFGSEVSSNYLSESIVQGRKDWLSSRIGFYRRMLSLTEPSESPAELGAKAFRNLRKFKAFLVPITKADRDFAEATVSSTESLHRFLIRKHMDYELENSEELWSEFAAAAFREIPELPE